MRGKSGFSDTFAEIADADGVIAAAVFDGTYTSGIVLSNPAMQNPATIGAGAYVTNTNTAAYKAAVLGASGFAWTITNLGTVRSGAGTLEYGVLLDTGGLVTNGQPSPSGASPALIAGNLVAVDIFGTIGTVQNFGTIEDHPPGPNRGGAVHIARGGIVENGNGGGTGALITADRFAVYIGGSGGTKYAGAAGTVINYGIIASTATSAANTAVALVEGGAVVNSGLIESAVGGAVDIEGASGTVRNSGTIASPGTVGTHEAVRLGAGGAVTNDGLIESASCDAVFIGGAAGTVVNNGVLLGSTAGGTLAAVNLTAGGSVRNTGTISSGAGNAIYLGASGTVTNYGMLLNGGTVASTILIRNGPGYVFNRGTIDSNPANAGIHLEQGYAANGDSGSPTALITGAGVGVEVDIRGGTPGGAGTVVNFGTILSTRTQGVRLGNGGAVTNYGLIAGAAAGVEVLGAAATVVDDGMISGTGSAGIGVVLAADGSTLVNAGTITDSSGTAVALQGSGELVVVEPGAVFAGALAGFNTSDTIDLAGVTATSVKFANGTLTVFYNSTVVDRLLLPGSYSTQSFVLTQDGSGGTDIQVRYLTGTYTSPVIIGADNPTTVEATGVVTVAQGNAVANQPGAAATLANFGTIVATGSGGSGVYLTDGGTVTNAASGGSAGLIAGYQAGIAIAGGSGTIDNAGTIAGTGAQGVGVLLGSGAAAARRAAAAYYQTLSNYGTVSGYIGVLAMAGSSNTVTNAGTISGYGGTALQLAGGYDRLIVDPGAYFQGVADGGGGGSVLELAGPAGLGGRAAPSVGTLAGIGSAFVNFGTLVVDAGGAWEAAGDGSAYQIVNDGMIIVANGIIAAGETLALGALGEDGGDTGVIEVGSHGLLDLTGAVDAGQTVIFVDATGTVALQQPGAFAGAITGFETGDTLDLAGVSGVAGYAGGILELTLGRATIDLQVSLASPAANPGFTAIPDGNGGSLISLGTASGITLSGSYSYGYVLNAANQNPATIAAGGYIGNNGVALLGYAGAAWTIVNYGAVYGSGAYGVGIALQSGGAITNRGAIGGYALGLGGYGGATTVLNDGTITSAGGTGVHLGAGGTLINAGTVAGYGGTAVQFAGARDRLMVEPGGGVPRQYRRRRPQRAGADGGGLRQPLRLQQLRHRLFDDYRRRRRLLDVVGRPRRRQADQRRHHRRRQRQRAGVRRRRRRQGPVRRHRTRRQRHRRFHRRGRQGPEPGVHRCLRHGAARRPGGIRGPDRGFQVGDVIDLIGVAADGFRYAKGRLALTEGGDTIATLAFAGHHRQADFQLADDGNGGTDIMLTPASRAPEALSSPAAGPPDFWMARG